MTQADRVLSTPPTNTSANNPPRPVDPTRRRFLAVAAVGSIAGAGSLAVAAATPTDIPQAVTVPQASPELRATIHHLDQAHANLKIAQAANEEAQAIWEDWEAQNPKPASKRGRRRWTRRADVERQALIAKSWQALMKAELAFASAQITVALAPIDSLADVNAMGAASIVYDRVELHRYNGGWIAIMIAEHVFKQGKAVLS